MSQDPVSREGSDVLAFRLDQLAATQQLEGSLDRALRKARFVGKHSQARGDRAPSRPRPSSIERQVNEVGSGLAIVTDNVTHQDVQDIIVDRNCLAKSRHGGK